MPLTSVTRRSAHRHRYTRSAGRLVVGLALVGATALYLVPVADGSVLASTAAAVLADPLGLTVVIACYATAFVLRAWAWRRTLPGLPFGQAWAALHVSLLGNHVLPFRLGEPLRVTSVLRRTRLATRPVVASAVTLRAADLAAVVSLAVIVAPAVAIDLVGPWVWPLGAALVGLTIGGSIWSAQLRRAGETIKPPPIGALGATVPAWALEAAVIWQIARQAGHALTLTEAVAVTAVTIAAQSLAVTPGGLGSYEATATAALVVLGVQAGPAFAIALTTHAIKTAYALAAGAVSVVAPAPSYLGRLRLPRARPSRPAPQTAAADRPVVAFIPVHNEEASVGSVVARLPATVAGRPLVTVVVDDGSTDGSGAIAAAAGAHVIAQPANLGLGAAVRRGLAEATAYEPAAIVYLDADGEYFPEDIDAVADPVLAGTADYVVGSRFAGRIDRMLPHRRIGNRLLTLWMRWLTRQPITDGQSGYRAFSPTAADAAEVIHDYNYAQVLTLDLLAKGFEYAEVPIRYSYRESGTSFVRLGRYLRKVIPAVYRELNAAAPDRSQAAASAGVPLTGG